MTNQVLGEGKPLGESFLVNDSGLISTPLSAQGAELIIIALDEKLISQVQKLVTVNNLTLNHDIIEKVVTSIDQDLVNLNKSLEIPPTHNPFEILSPIKVLVDEGDMSDGNKVAFDLGTNLPLAQTSLFLCSPFISPSKWGRKPKAFHTQLEIDAGIQSTLFSSGSGSLRKKYKFSPPLTSSIATKRNLQAAFVVGKEGRDNANKKRGDNASPRGQ